MENLLRQLLEGQQQITKRFDRMEESQQQITKRFDRMEEGQQQITKRLNRMEESQQQITKRLDHMEESQQQLKEDIAGLRTTVTNIEGQQIENSRFIHALRHNSEEVNAQLHNIGHNLDVLTGRAATKEDITELNAKFDLLNNRLFQQEVAIHQLKAVK